MATSPDIVAKAQALLSELGEVRPQPESDWRGSIPLPPDVAAFYQQVGPVDLTIEAGGNPYFFPSLARLWDFQAGYRWNGETQEPFADWNDDWLVIADEGGDPLIFDRATSKILFALHGEDRWEPEEAFGDIATMAACLGTLGSIFTAAGDDFEDDDFNINPKHIESAVTQIAEIVGSPEAADAVVSRGGWV